MRRPAAPFVVLAVVALVATVAFAWPAARLAPRDLPVGVIGAPPPALATASGFEVHRYASDAAAQKGIRDREVYGAFSARTLYVASAAGPAVAAGLREAAPGARVVDVVPASPRDPRGATLGALTLPLMLVGIVTAVLAFFTAPTLRRRLALIGASASFAGVAGALVAQTWLDALPGPWLAVAGSVALVVGAVAATVTGLAARIGRPGIGIGAVLMMFVANPWSGVTSAPELLPEPAGALGQLMPAGAGGSLLRSVAFFDGAGGAEHLIVLAAWALGGLALLAAGALRSPGGAAVLSPSRGTAAP